MIRSILAGSRFLIIIAVAGAFTAATTLLVYGGIETALQVWHTITAGKVGSEAAKELAFAFIELIDLFLLATVFYIIALGLYALFIFPEPADQEGWGRPRRAIPAGPVIRSAGGGRRGAIKAAVVYCLRGVWETMGGQVVKRIIPIALFPALKYDTKLLRMTHQE